MSDAEKEICRKLFDLRKWIPEFGIDNARRAGLCFRETLMICLKNESTTDARPVGGYCILVEPLGPKGREFLIHVQSSMSIGGHFGGSKVISSATEQFHCLEEKRTEFVYKDGGLHEKTIFIGIHDDSYHVKIKRVCPCKKLEECRDLSISCNNRFISEGISLLLMRYLALVNYEGTLSLESITADGDTTTCNYNCKAAEQMEIDDHFLSVYTIERKIRKEDGSAHDVKSYLTSQGKIIRHDWKDVPYVLKMNPLVDANVRSKPTEIGAPLRDRWSEDIEMFSKYLDMKSSKVAEYTEYLADHPEFKHMIADYTHTLLVGNQTLNRTNFLPILLNEVVLNVYQRFLNINLVSVVKPANVIDFTIQHFKAFAKDPKAWETSELDQDIKFDFNLQLAKEKTEVACGFCVNDRTSSEISMKSSTERSPEITTPPNSRRSSVSESSNVTTPSTEVSMSIGEKEKHFNLYNILPQRKKFCQCTSQPHPECPRCLKLNLNSICKSLSDSEIAIANRNDRKCNDWRGTT